MRYKAALLIKDMTERAHMNQSESTTKAILQAETGCILASQQKLTEASAAFKQAIESPFFEQITALTERQRFLKSYGDVLFKQGNDTEAAAIYAKRAALAK